MNSYLSQAHIDAFEIIRDADDLKWSYIAPPAQIEPGERTGEYRTAEGQLVATEDGESSISMEDFAIAFTDELVNIFERAQDEELVNWYQSRQETVREIQNRKRRVILETSPPDADWISEITREDTISAMNRNSFHNLLITDCRTTVRENIITPRRRILTQTLRGLAQKSVISAENTAIIDSSVLFPIDSGTSIHHRDPEH
jgi:hypothetical protein